MCSCWLLFCLLGGFRFPLCKVKQQTSRSLCFEVKLPNFTNAGTTVVEFIEGSFFELCRSTHGPPLESSKISHSPQEDLPTLCDLSCFGPLSRVDKPMWVCVKLSTWVVSPKKSSQRANMEVFFWYPFNPAPQNRYQKAAHTHKQRKTTIRKQHTAT